MKRVLLLFGLLFIGTSVLAVTEPFAKYMAALKSCTAGTYKQEQSGLISTYKIKGKTKTGRCIVEYSNYTDFSNTEIYNNAIGMMKAFGGGKISEADLPTQEQIIAQELRDKTTTTCKFSQKEIDQLYAAYLAHDGNPTSVTKKPDGTTRYSFDLSKMGSYDSLRMKFSQGGPCTTTSANDPQERKGSVYACEYAGRTCYVTKYSNTSWTASCNPNIAGDIPWDTLQKYVNQGMCEKL